MQRKNLSKFIKAVLNKTKQIPKGRVSTYGAIARAIGRPKAARAVGNALNKNPYAPEIACHRVVKSNGVIGGFARGKEEKARMLQAEGIKITKNKIENFKSAIFSL